MTNGQRSALITGANGGIGREVARQLALSGEYDRILLAGRNIQRLHVAKCDLQNEIERVGFEVIVMDVADPASVHGALNSLDRPIDDLVMNAGGSGGKQPLALTSDGVTRIFATNVLGHAVLLERLLQTDRLTRSAVFVGSEAARGVPRLRMAQPTLSAYSIDEFTSLCNGTFFSDRKVDDALAYGQVKFVGAMWMAALARRYPALRLLTVSPGNTRGTNIAAEFPLPKRLFFEYVLMPLIAPALGIVHDIGTGARRLVNAVLDPGFASGNFYASAADAVTGPLVNQGAIYPALDKPGYQDNAATAVERFVEAVGNAQPVSRAA